MIHVLRPGQANSVTGAYVVNVTSRVKSVFSPFTLGPCDIPGRAQAKNVENAWQFSKVYDEHVAHFGNGARCDCASVGAFHPNGAWYRWSEAGYQDSWAHRYPMGRGAVPEFSWWDGSRLDYIEARKHIYIPLYSSAVLADSGAMNMVSVLSHRESLGEDIVLVDFDAYDHRALGYAWNDVVNDDSRKMGHGFVLAMMLEGVL